MLPSDLTNGRKAHARSSGARSARAIKWRKDPLTLSRGDATSTVAHRQYSVAAAQIADTHLDRRCSMLLGILNEVANHPSEQSRVATDRDRLPRDVAFRAACTFLCG